MASLDPLHLLEEVAENIPDRLVTVAVIGGLDLGQGLREEMAVRFRQAKLCPQPLESLPIRFATCRRSDRTATGR